MKKQGFSKNERLTGRKKTGKLFASGRSFYCRPFQVVWEEHNLSSKSPVQLLISVPKRKFKQAVKRNRIKRLIREAWRLNKQELYAHLLTADKKLMIAVVYTSDQMPVYSEISHKIIVLLQRLIRET